MEAKNYLIGGIVSRELLAKLAPLLALSSDFDYRSTKDNMSMFLLARGKHFICRENAKQVFILAGHICYSGKEAVNLEALEEIERYYLTNAHFPIEHLEGSFTIILLDKTEATLTIYRNILGLPSIYYTRTQKGAIFSDSLPFLARMVTENRQSQLKLNRSQLPEHFMFGRVSGRSTLFKDIFRMLPGEQGTFRGDSLTFLQLQTFDSMIGPKINNCVEYLECVMQKIINEYARTYPHLGNLFSGGVDSSYIQAHLDSCSASNLTTFSVDLIHPSWRKEHEYAKSGNEFFKSHHTFVKIDPLAYPSLLIETTAMLGHPICHAQTAFVSELSREIVHSASVCLCGMAADTLFGTEDCRHIDIALQINKLTPWKFPRQMMAQIVEIIYKTRLSSDRLKKFHKCLTLDLVNDSSPNHPFNESTAHSEGTNLELMFDIFGKRKVTKVMSERRDVLIQYQAIGGLKERLHSLYLLGTHQSCERFYQLAAHAGLKLIFPYLDSRIIKVALSMNANCRFPFMQTKKVLKDALGKYLPKELIFRKKSAWGVPLVEWLRGEGVLGQLVEKINAYPFLGGSTSIVKRTQNRLLWNLLTFDLWHKLFIDRNSLT